MDRFNFAMKHLVLICVLEAVFFGTSVQASRRDWSHSETLPKAKNVVILPTQLQPDICALYGSLKAVQDVVSQLSAKTADIKNYISSALVQAIPCLVHRSSRDEKQRLDVIRYLISLGVNFNFKSLYWSYVERDEHAFGQLNTGTPLMVAAEKWHLPVILLDILFQAGAVESLNTLNEKGETATDRAAAAGNLEAFSRLESMGGLYNIHNKRMYRLFNKAIEKGRTDIVRKLVERGFGKDTNKFAIPTDALSSYFPVSYSQVEDTPGGIISLTLSVLYGDLETVKYLLDGPIDLDDQHPFNNSELLSTAIYYASRENTYEMLQLLLAAHASPHVRDGNGKTPLIELASNKGDFTPHMQLLLDAGADVNAFDNLGTTALDKAIECGNAKTIKFLRDRNALSGSAFPPIDIK